MKQFKFFLTAMLFVAFGFNSCTDDTSDLENQITELRQALSSVQDELKQNKESIPEAVDLSGLESAIATIQEKLSLLENVETPEDVDLSGIILSVSKLQGEIEILKSKEPEKVDLSGINANIQDILDRLAIVETFEPEEVDLSSIINRLSKIEEALEKQSEKIPQATKGEENGHEWVDLGTNVLWATCNVGANKPEDIGMYFEWGGINNFEPRNYFDKGYKIYNNKGGLTELKPEHDAATVNWGGKWRMPSVEELEGLIKICTSKWTQRNGVNGRLFTSLINGQSIFLPAAGRHSSDSYGTVKLMDIDSYGFYWSSTLTTRNKDEHECAMCFKFYKSLYSVSPHVEGTNAYSDGISYYSRSDGFSIRPVCSRQ